MPRVRGLHRASVAAASLLLGALLTTPATAADGPSAAVEAFLDAVAGRQLDDLDALVCPPQHEAMREAFSDGSLGLDLLEANFGELTLSIRELTIELVDAAAGAAEAEVTGTLAVEVEEAALRDFVRELIDAGAASEDPPATEADVDATLFLLEGELGLDIPIDDAVRLVREDGDWLVCGGFEAVIADPGPAVASEPIISSDGLCGLASPGELSQLSRLAYDSSIGVDEFCTYSQSDWDEYHAATVSLLVDTTLEDWRPLWVPDGVLEVGGAAGYSSGSSVLVEAGPGVLQVMVSLREDTVPDVDPVAQATAIAELFLSRPAGLDRVALELEPVAYPVGPTLCDAVSLPTLSDASGRAFDVAEGDASYCAWSSSEPGTDRDTVLAIVIELTLDEMRQILSGTTDGEVAGMPAISTPTQTVVGLPDGRTLHVSVDYDERLAPTVPATVVAEAVAGWVAPTVPPWPIDEGG